MRVIACFLLLLAAGALVADEEPAMPPVIRDYLPLPEVRSQLNKLAPVVIDFDRSLLTVRETAALKKLVQAGRLIDEIFLRQVYGLNPPIRQALETGKDPAYPLLRQYFQVNFGPFDRLEHDRPFINLSSQKPEGANFYPTDMAKEEFTSWLKNHPEQEKAFTSNFTLIARESGRLVAVPYSQAYREFLEPAAALLRQAAELSDNPSLRKFLNSRAAAFASNDYYASDIDWMDLSDHALEVVIGPYEVYEDGLFGYKASFEAFLTIVDPEESRKLKTLADYLDEMEQNLPLPAEKKMFSRGKASPIVVAQAVYTAGDTKAAVQTTAFNLPNDERVREAKGSKKVMLKNVARAKFDHCWTPIVREALAAEDLPYVSFDAYFTHVLMHEVSHGLGPGRITKGGRDTTASLELKETYPTLEEAKADILGVWNVQFLIDKGIFPADLEKKLYISFLGGTFRSVRFGIHEAHGGGMAIIFNYLREKGGFVFDPGSGRFRIDFGRIKSAVRDLSAAILLLQANGDYEGAKAFIARYRILSTELQRTLARVASVPVDIRPEYAIEKEVE